MVKQTQTICQQKTTNCLSVFDHFVGLAFKGLKRQQYFSPTHILKVTKTETNLNAQTNHLLNSHSGSFSSISRILWQKSTFLDLDDLFAPVVLNFYIYSTRCSSIRTNKTIRLVFF